MHPATRIAIEDLPDMQRRALAALITGATQPEAAVAAGVEDRTVRRWLADPDVSRLLREARAARWSETSGLLQSAAREAVEALREIVRDGKHEYARVAASRALLEHAGRAAALEDVQARLAELEERFNAALEGRLDVEPSTPGPEPAGAGEAQAAGLDASPSARRFLQGLPDWMAEQR